MAIKLNTKYLENFMNDSDFKAIQPFVITAHNLIEQKNGLGNDFLGWLTLPEDYDKSEFRKIIECADKIKNDRDILLVIGIGGSYLGSRAVIEAIQSPLYNNFDHNTPKIYFLGNNLSADYFHNIMTLCDGKDISVNVISKSGTTTEPAIAFRLVKQYMDKRYGPNAANRIYATTDKAKGTLKTLADREGYQTFVIPDNIGGRYSVLTAVGLLPIACAGIDIDQLMQGAQTALEQYKDSDINKNDCYKYAAIRNILLRKNYTTEVTVAYNPSLQCYQEWIKQLFGESEGKDNKGTFPTSMIFSTDLHSLGQYLQQGLRNISETVLWVKNEKEKVLVTHDPENLDGLNFLAGNDLHAINEKAYLGTALAHTSGGVPNTIIELDNIDTFTIGQLIYFYEKACAISAYLLGVNPFDQPGVQLYKSNMFALLGKPGYENQKSSLEKLL